MSEIVVGRTRTGWDVVLGALLIIGGIIILANAVIATKVSVLFLGWVLLISGLFGLVAAVLSIGRGNAWTSAIGGGLLTVLGLMFLRHSHAAALTLTLIAGSLFLVTGLVRLVAAAEDSAYRWPLLFSGAISTILGLIVLFNLFDASYSFLGIILGIETIADGISLLLVGRLRILDATPARHSESTA